MKQIETSPFYYKSLMSATSHKLDYAAWDKSVELFKQKEYKQSFYTFLDYLDAGIRKGQTPDEFTVPHGSALVNIKLTDARIEVKARVLKVNDDTLKIPLMRALCEINFEQLGIAQACIENNEVLFYCNFDYALASPRKVYDALWDICRYADKYDDEFVEKFKADFIAEPQVKHYTQAELDMAWFNMQRIITTALNAYSVYDEDRRNTLRYFTLTTALTQLEFALQPQGYLKTRFEQEISDIYDSDEDFEYRLKKGKDFLNELKGMSKEEVYANLYSAKLLTPEKNFTSVDNIRHNWSNSFDRVREAMNNKDYEFATLDMLFSIYSMFSYNNARDAISNPILDTLEKASNKPWKESADLLYEVFCFFMIEGYTMKSPQKDNLFIKILKHFLN